MKIDALPPSSADGSGSAYNFTVINDPKASFPSVRDQDNRDALLRWNLLPFMQAKCFRFDQAFAPEHADAFLRDFFSSPMVQEAAPVCTGPGSHTIDHVGQFGPLGDVTEPIKYHRLPTTVLRLDFFDRVKDEGLVRAGDIAGCFDVPCGDILVSDRLRKMILDESSEEWELYSEQERNELIFHVMKRLAVGGGMNQYDNQFQPYLDITKKLYKDLVTVSKSAAGALQVSSITYEIESVSGTNQSLWPRQNTHNFCYVVVDPLARHVKLWYCAWFPMSEYSYSPALP